VATSFAANQQSQITNRKSTIVNQKSAIVTAPSDAEETRAAYLANTPVL
jgi:hypothetical protein